VPDDWDAEDQADTSDARPESTYKLWEEANARDPQPKVVLATTAGSSTPSQIPDSLLNAPRTILKRPASSSTAPTTSSTQAAGQKTIQEREASYLAARDRIFGPGSSGSSSPAGEDAVNRTPVPSNVIRPPRGPPSVTPVGDPVGAVEPAPAPLAGFAGRVAKKRGHGRTVSDLEGIMFAGGSAAGTTPMDTHS